MPPSGQKIFDFPDQAFDTLVFHFSHNLTILTSNGYWIAIMVGYGLITIITYSDFIIKKLDLIPNQRSKEQRPAKFHSKKL